MEDVEGRRERRDLKNRRRGCGKRGKGGRRREEECSYTTARCVELDDAC
jgi:hypothetical protein